MELLMTLFKKSPLSILPNLIIIIFFFQQDTLMRKLTCKTLMEILPGEVFFYQQNHSPPHTHAQKHTNTQIFMTDLQTYGQLLTYINHGQSMLQVVGRIQKEMAEKKLTSDFETVAKHIIIMSLFSQIFQTITS